MCGRGSWDLGDIPEITCHLDGGAQTYRRQYGGSDEKMSIKIIAVKGKQETAITVQV